MTTENKSAEAAGKKEEAQKILRKIQEYQDRFGSMFWYFGMPDEKVVEVIDMCLKRGTPYDLYKDGGLKPGDLA